ncbi:hypothetical protein AALO_G00094470 [Alosa alosa]|uniref:Ig-like domain-containing protein n=1 Tax=Alosa alosa TaxID=278164 RepID=A0AAV6GT47_9TELE|nr:butyrophilin subfamily 1 member A1-like isoform X1 [Alosa alosa]KAG5278035.1 hypothetical protein AALO_G00094470 [Alosa alosa]
MTFLSPGMLMIWLCLITSPVQGHVVSDCDPAVFILLGSEASVPGWVGSSVTLPCRLSPAISAVSFEVRWYQPNGFDHPVLLYKDQHIQQQAADPRYTGTRASLVGNLENGNVSLKLENLTLADRGEYMCYVESDVWYDMAKVNVTVKVVGDIPVMSFSDADESGQVTVTCVSDGWSPEPSLYWALGNVHVPSRNHLFITGDDGLVRVSSWLLVSPSESEWVSCSVGLSDQDRRESRIAPHSHNYMQAINNVPPYHHRCRPLSCALIASWTILLFNLDSFLILL